MDMSWKTRLVEEFSKDYFRDLVEFVREERRSHVVFPAPGDVFNAYKLTPFPKARVLILGQDPYHNAGQAHGLAFSVLPGVRPPPSLQNIFKELQEDLGVPVAKTGYLQGWATQGVFLLNATLTVRAHQAGSHQGKGWETFTDSTLKLLSAKRDPMVFVLWGRYARDKRALIDTDRHTVIESAHPSPMSAAQGFFGSRPFSRINEALRRYGQEPVDWAL